MSGSNDLLNKSIGGVLLQSNVTPSNLLWRFDIQSPHNGITYIYVINRFIPLNSEECVPGDRWDVSMRDQRVEKDDNTFTRTNPVSHLPELDNVPIHLFAIYEERELDGYTTWLTFSLSDDAILYIGFHPCTSAVEIRLSAMIGTPLADRLDKLNKEIEQLKNMMTQPGTSTIQ